MSEKDKIRAEIRRRLREVDDREGRSGRICDHVFGIAEFQTAEYVLCYVEFGFEVIVKSIRDFLLETPGKRLVVPWCDGDELRLFRLESHEELAPGAYGILEPKPQLRELHDREIAPEMLQFVILSGLAFDLEGGRLGRGKGYFDRLIDKLSGGVITCAPVFDVQLINEVPMEEFDRYVDIILTENAISVRAAKPASAPLG